MNEDFELAALLRDAHPPEAPPWWPLAPGWWFALFVLLVLAAYALRLLRPWWRRTRLRRRLLAALSAAASEAEVSQLLRAAALERFPEQPHAGLHGAQWIAFLEARDRAPGRFAALHAALAESPYRPPRAGGELAPLREAARGWLRAVL